jgi:HK97 family phage major capsid protein
MERLSALTDRLVAEERSMDFVRWVASIFAAKGAPRLAASIFENRFPRSKNLHVIRKSAQNIGIATDSDWAGPLVEYAGLATAFVESLRPQSVFVRLYDSMMPAPLRTRMVAVTGAAQAALTGEGKPIRVSEMALSGKMLMPLKAAAIVVLSDEVVNATSPAGLQLIDRELRGATTAAIDGSFLALLADEITPTAATGNDAAAALADLRALFQAVNTSSGDLYLVMAQDVAKAAATLAGPGGLVFPAMGPQGGVMLNLPALVTDRLAAGTLMLINAAGIAADIGVVQFATGQQAVLQLDDAPDDPPTSSTPRVSLFQDNLTAIRAVYTFGAERFRANSVAILDGVAWGAAE